MRLDLKDGEWAELWSPRKVKERKRRAYIAALTDLSAATAELPRDPAKPGEPDPRFLRGEQMALADRVGDLLILCLVREWSFGDVNDETLSELVAEHFDPIFKACRDLTSELLPDFGADPDPKVPGGGSTP